MDRFTDQLRQNRFARAKAHTLATAYDEVARHLFSTAKGDEELIDIAEMLSHQSELFHDEADRLDIEAGEIELEKQAAKH